MKIKLSPVYLLAFFSLLFLVNELHEWAHVLVGLLMSGCWGTKGFDNWTVCNNGKMQALAWLAGPLITYTALWTGYWLMDVKKSSADRSLGFSIFFAALPFSGILAAFRGRSDETVALHEFFQNADGSNRVYLTIAGSLIVLLLTLPSLVRALKIAAAAKQKLLLFLLFFFVPVIVEYIVVQIGMNALLSQGILPGEALPGTPLLVILWGFAWLILLMFTYRHLLKLFKKSHQRRRRSNPDVTTE